MQGTQRAPVTVPFSVGLRSPPNSSWPACTAQFTAYDDIYSENLSCALASIRSPIKNSANVMRKVRGGKMARSRSLVTFAFVHDALKSGDIVSGLMPLLAPVIKKRYGKVFDPKVFAQDINDYYGLVIHHYVAEDWTQRLAKAGLITPVPGAKEDYASYICTDPVIDEVSVAEADLNKILNSFESYAAELFSEVDLELPSRDSLEAMFIERIKDMSFENIASKPDSLQQKPNTLSLTKLVQPEDSKAKIEQALDVVTASFVLDLQEKSPEDFKLIMEITAGVLASEVVLSFRSPPRRGQNFKSKIIILDSPLVLDYLNLGGIEDHGFAKSLIEDLASEGATVSTYSHNVDELIDILTAAKHNMGDKFQLSGSVGMRLLTDRNAFIRLNAVLGNPYAKVKQAGIQIIDTNSIDRPYLRHFDKNAEQDLLGSIRPFSRSRIESRVFDAASIASMIRYLFGKRPRGNLMAYEKLFVTKNSGLANAAAKYMKNIHAIAEDSDPPILTDRMAAGIVWLAKGGEGTDIPLKKLVANCTSAVRLRKDVITKMHGVLQNTSPDEAKVFEALIEEDRCGYYLMRHSLGAAELVTDANALDLLERVKRATAERVIQEAEAKAISLLQGQRLEYEQKLEAAATALAVASSAGEDAVKTAKDEVDSLARKKEEVEKALSEYKDKHIELADKFSRLVAERKMQDRRIAEALFRSSKKIDWILRVAFYLTTFILSLMGQTLAQIHNNFWMFGGSLLLVFILGLVQFSIFPDVLIGAAIRRRREDHFRRNLNASEFSGKVSFQIDWKEDRLKFDE